MEIGSLAGQDDRAPDSYQSGLEFDLFAQLRDAAPHGM